MPPQQFREYAGAALSRLDPPELQAVLEAQAEAQEYVNSQAGLHLEAPPPEPLSEPEAEWMEEVRATELWQRSFGQDPRGFSVGRVPVDQLVTPQYSLKSEPMSVPDDPLGRIRWLIPHPEEFESEYEWVPESTVWDDDAEQGRFVYATDDPKPDIVPQPSPEGLLIGPQPHLNWVQVVKLGSRYIVKNGNHRLAATIDAGYEQVPALILERDSLAHAGLAKPGMFPEDFLRETGRPPMVSDFLDEEATVEVPAPEMRRVLEIQVNVRRTSVPV